jgi:hypothetical protein
MATNPQIAVKVENVVSELTDIRRGVAAVQEELAKMYLAGPWSGAAADFHLRVKNALSEAETSSHTLIGRLELLESKVRVAVEGMSGQDMSAEKIFSDLNEAPPLPTSAPPSSAASATKSSIS